MRILCSRFTMRGLMVAVAIMGIAFGMIDRHYRFKKMADHHLAKLESLDIEKSLGIERPSPFFLALVNYHASLGEKYAKAARYPWLPVAPDPPEPK
jgi:hypothetical protein